MAQSKLYEGDKDVYRCQERK